MILLESFFFNSLTFKDPINYVIPAFVILIVWEFFVLTRKLKKTYDKKEAAASIGMGIGSVIINLASKAVWVGLFFVLFKYRIFDFLAPTSIEELTSLDWHLNHWWVWLALFISEDFVFYWHHRTAHEIRILWAGHVNHHSSQDYNFAIALRQGWWEEVYKYFWWMFLPLIGFHPVMVLTQVSINLIYQFFLHTETVNKLGILEYVFNTPSHHRVHHGSNLKYLDTNYAGTLIIWDRLFGTFQKEEEKSIYGITENINTKNLFKIASHELVAISKDVSSTKSIKYKLSYLFKSPGWSHKGEDKRAKILRNLAKE